jgi:putative holliday junction resolvase
VSRALGVDLGEVRIGLAISDPARMVATPLETVAVPGSGGGPARGTRTERSSDPGRIAEVLTDVAAEHDATTVVIGLPRALSGREGRPAQHARAVAAALTAEGWDVVLWDERFSTAEAERVMLGQGAKRRERSAAIDRVAATLVLQTYLDSRR